MRCRSSSLTVLNAFPLASHICHVTCGKAGSDSRCCFHRSHSWHGELLPSMVASPRLGSYPLCLAPFAMALSSLMHLSQVQM